eukprot:1377561-Karenia_brevis.AAC.1
MKIERPTLETSITGQPSSRMRINVRVIDRNQTVRRLNDLTDEEYQDFRAFFCNGTHAARNKYFCTDVLGK